MEKDKYGTPFIDFFCPKCGGTNVESETVVIPEGELAAFGDEFRRNEDAHSWCGDCGEEISEELDKWRFPCVFPF